MTAESKVRLGWLWLAGSVATGAAIRLFRLDRQSFWYDEAVSARIAAAPFWDILSGRERDLGNPPLHHLLLNLWSQVFGLGDAALRSLSAAASIAAIPAVHAVARRLAGERAALIAAGVMALAPIHVYFAQETRTYAIVTLLVVLNVLMLLRAEEKPERVGRWIAYAASIFLCAYAHYFAFFFLTGQLAYVALTHGRDRAVLLPWIGSVVGGAGLYLVWIPSFLAQVSTTGNLSRSADSWLLHGMGTPLVFSVGTTLLWKDTVSVPRILAAAVALVAFGAAFLAGCWHLRVRRKRLALLLLWLLSPIALPLLISVALFPFYNVRYAVIAAPAMAILVAAGLDGLPRFSRLAVACAVASTSLLSLASYFTSTVKHDWRSAAAELDGKVRPGDVLVFDVDTGETPFGRYARSRAPRLRLLRPKQEALGVFFGSATRSEEPRDISLAVASAPRIWFVRSDPNDGSGDYYRGAFEAGFRSSTKLSYRGIDITLYEPAVRAMR